MTLPAAGDGAAIPPFSRWYRSGAVTTDMMVIGLIVIAIIGFSDDRPWITILCAVVVTVTVVARGWSRLALAEVTYRLATSHRRVVAGDSFELTLTAENRKALPLPWLHITEIVPAGLSIVASEAGMRGQTFSGGREISETVGVGAHARVNLRVQVRADRRGHYTFGPASIRSGDIFGFYQTWRDFRRFSADLVVYPRPFDLGTLDFPAARPIGDALSRLPMAEDLTRPSGVREYQPGDAAHRLDWKTTARRGRPFVRTHDPSVAQCIVLMVECRTSDGDTWGIDPEMLEAVVDLAAAVVLRALKQGFRVGLVVNGNPLSDRAPPVVAPGAGKGRLTVLMDCLAAASSIATQPPEALIERHGAAALPFGATIVYVTGILPTGTVAFLERRARRGHRVVTLYAGRRPPPDLPGLGMSDLRDALRRGRTGDE